ncbi:hypothetical protein VTI28DRAFT_640 [Corynascus sepedonium]
MLSSLSIDSFVGIIYRVLGGSNGGQGIPFFSDMSRRLSDHSQSPRSLLSLVVSSLHELFRRERKALLNDDLPDLLDALRHKAEQLANLTHDAETDPADLDGVSIRINMISKMMDGVRGVVSNDQSFGAMTAGNSGTVRSTFPLEVVIPGGNHDNDFADITKIQIFPTFGEVMSDAAEYLPTTDFSRPLFLRDPVQRYIDSAFRLLRHDIFGALKQVVGAILAQPHVADAASSNQFLTGNIKAHVYPRAGMQHILVDKNGGFETVVSFARPPQLRKLSLADQRRWWEDSSRLEPGGLVCFVSGSGDRKSFLLLVVTKKNTAEAKEGKNISTLISNRSNPAVTMRLASETSENMAMLNQIYVKKEEGLLIELPGLIPDTFVPILQNLQRMMRDGDLAFRQWIIPPTDHEGEQPVTEISPPAYTRRPGFKFRLQTITRSGYPALTVNPAVGDGDISAESLEAATGLDHGQATSLIAALTREYALIQGPPGTGKSYVGVQLVRVLLDHKVEAKLGPILIICYTNHALDQFLKHLMDVGIDKIIRIGGQSRAEELDGKNLRTVSQGMSKTKVEQRILGRSYSEAEGRFQDAGARLKSLHQARKGKPDWNMLKSFLFEQYPTIAKQFESLHQDNAGYKLVGNRDPVRLWLGNQQGQAARRDEVPAQNDAADLTLRAQQNINSLTTSERWTLVKSWIRQLTQLQSDRAFEFVKEAKGHRDEIQRVHDDVNRRTLLQADVVGITTTGLARNMNMLCRLGVKIVICEEAAEIENYLQFSMETATGRAYQLDRSQFERRAVGEPGLQALPVAQLNVQRRMRPEISQLIRRVYPDLEDHDCVKNLPSVVGMQNNLFWLDHDHPEDANDDGTRVKSHSNTWEVSMAKALIRHLVRQGEYKSTDIALLTPYTGQLRKLRASLSDDFEVFLSDRDLETLAKEGIEANPDQGQTVDIGTRKVVEKKKLLQTIRLATVDNFQGEEAKVIVVSLVRSNNNAKVGFLRTENRINVLLSRAQHGMYLIGNTKTYQNVPMWADVHQQLSSRKAVGTSIALCCPRHPDTPLLCSEPSDFTVKSPEGGCSQICDKRLEPSDAPTHAVIKSARSPVPRVLKSALGLASTRARAHCPAPHLATDYLATNAALNCSSAIINAQLFAVDFMEFKTYGEIDLNETPIAVLGCGHFFTGETLDRMVGMSSVYTTDNLEKYNGLQELSGQLTTIPACPNCRVPIRQFATRRYNRVINKAVLDETSKRFLVGGREKLAGLEERVTMTEKELADSRDSMILANMDLRSTFWDRHKTARRLEKETARLRKDMEAENQPTRKLFDAVMNFKRLQREQSLEKQLQCLSLSEPEITIPQQQAYDQQITLNAHRLQLRIQEAILRDVFTLLSKRNGPLNSAPILPGGHTLDKCSSRFLNQCKQLINNAEAAKLPRLVIQTILSYARVTQLDGWYHRTIAAATTAPNSNSQMADNVSTGDKTSNETAIELLDRALNLCITIPAPDGDSYRAEVEETIKLFAETRYEEVTPAEIAAIKAAMVSGPRGLATHSGHWYTCRNGHPFAIGECGMPMERALCPECGETIGGSNHTPVEGVERDERMERA